MKPVIYTTPDCVQCNSTKAMFDRAGVEYDTVDLSKDSAALDMVKELGYTSAPVVTFNNTHWSGFRFSKIRHTIEEIKGEGVHKK
jgi:glutaredoxin-like protein NrdH